MHRLGVSVYPEKSSMEDIRAYLEKAADFGFTRIFTCLLSVTSSPEKVIEEFGGFVSMAHDLGFVVAADTNPEVFEKLGATPFDLTPFAMMGLDIIRLDGHFGDMGDIAITRNREGIGIEFNASGNVALDLLVERGADPRNMSCCHNFFPERFTGLGEETFQSFSRKYKRDCGLPVAAFVTSREPNTFGPWEVFCGLPTCEDDRTRPIDLQARHLVASGLVDDVIIGNCFASEAELGALGTVDLSRVAMRVDVLDGLSAAELDVLTGFEHATRGDASDYMLRSSTPRTTYRGLDGSVPVRALDAPSFARGDVMVVNDNLPHYRGELEIALRDMPDDGTRNLVGRIPEEERFLLDYIKPDNPFALIVS